MVSNLEKDISRMKKINRILLFLVLSPYLIGALTTLVSKKQLPNTVIYTDQTTGTNITSSLSGSTRSVVLSETRGAFENLILEFVTNNTSNSVWIQADSITVNNTSTSDRIALTSVSVTATISASVGENGPDKSGLDTSSVWRSLWVIGKTDGTKAALISSARDDRNTSGALNIPSGYSYWKRVGWVRNDSSSNFIPFVQFNNRQWYQNAAFTNNKVVNGGNSTTATIVDCSSFCPPTSRLMSLGVDGLQSGGNNTVNITFDSIHVPAGANNIATWFNFLSPIANGEIDNYGELPMDSLQRIRYRTNQSTCTATIWVTGYEDNL